MLGKKTNIESKETKKKSVNFVNENIQSPDTKLYGAEEELINADKSFRTDSFLKGAEVLL